MPPATEDTSMTNESPAASESWETRLASLLDELSGVQNDLLRLLDVKRERLVAKDREALEAMQPEEQTLIDRLAVCQQRRQSLLDAAAAEGLPSTDLRAVADSMPAAERDRLRPALREARRRSRLVQHQSLTNWVLVQRTLLHLSQMVEIIATGGRKSPTYEKSGPSAAGGALVDHAV